MNFAAVVSGTALQNHPYAEMFSEKFDATVKEVSDVLKLMCKKYKILQTTLQRLTRRHHVVAN